MSVNSMYQWPDYYDWTSDGVEGDVEYYTELAVKSGGPVLELGCGTGRCSLAIARQGISVVGMDNEPAMLARAQAKSEALGLRDLCHWVEGDMSRLDLGERFPLIIIPYRSFLHLLTVKEQVSLLNAVRRHLPDDGMFAFNVFVPHISEMHDIDDRVVHRGTFPIPGDQGCIEVFDHTRFRHFLQQADITRYYERFDGKGASVERLRTAFRIRYVFPVELNHLLRLTGFEIVNRYGNFGKEPFHEHSTELIIEAKKAAGH
ncbi:type 12 methyltransferase [Marinithermofilum abyssi]|uniref:Type 12 methyltransferase n=1 Tax=Marinithermofilum abyssi TaxID=1571185 RepID=A0A8J2YEW7_9BACL|nr:class I SAM-dependent methyltransferase [Marinithermofilum abyssi]GGE27075.1 type 12 methyltransferase [Marinithermofilum abyssi]